MEAFLGLLSTAAQSTAIPLLTMSVMLRCVYGPGERKIPETPLLDRLLSMADAFEPQTAPIWDSQLPALELIHSAPFPGIRIGEVEYAFSNCKEAFPEIFEGSTFSDWLKFCQRQDLFLIYGQRVLLSTTGRKFMQSRVSAEVSC